VFGYYFGLAIRNLRRNPMITALVIAAIGVGISASVTTLTVYRGMAGDPIPQKAGELFAPQIDNWGPNSIVKPGLSDHLEDQLSYRDAKNLMALRGARQQVAMYRTSLVLTPSKREIRPFNASARATNGDFFRMFDVPFRYGGGWTAADDQNRAAVAVISHALDDDLFGGANSVGRNLRLNGQSYRIVGVLGRWRPIPRFYDLGLSPYGKTDDVFIPFTRGIDQHLRPAGFWACNARLRPGWDGLTGSECVWIQFWVELRTPAAVKAYRSLLVNYAGEQRRLGRFRWAPRVQLRDVRQWLAYHHLVSDEVRILVLLSFAFLVVCLVNAMALMLAKLIGRAGDIGVRRALGASSRSISFQCAVESATVGIIGGALGIALTVLSFKGLRALLSGEGRALLHLDGTDAALAMLLAVVVTMLVGLYPTWKAARLQPSLQLKAV
jgi:putative ABC transport system permease protein